MNDDIGLGSVCFLIDRAKKNNDEERNGVAATNKEQRNVAWEIFFFGGLPRSLSSEMPRIFLDETVLECFSSRETSVVGLTHERQTS